MDEDPSSHRLRWVLILLLLGTAVWVARSRQGSTESEPALPAPDETDAPARLRSTPASAAAPVEPPAPPAPPASVDSPTTVLPVVEAPGGRAARARRSTVVEIPPSAAPAAPDGSPPGPEYTIKAKSGSELFHGPDSPYFGRTRAEFWFRTAADARAAGFTEWTPRRRSTG